MKALEPHRPLEPSTAIDVIVIDSPQLGYDATALAATSSYYRSPADARLDVDVAILLMGHY